MTKRKSRAAPKRAASRAKKATPTRKEAEPRSRSLVVMAALMFLIIIAVMASRINQNSAAPVLTAADSFSTSPPVNQTVVGPAVAARVSPTPRPTLNPALAAGRIGIVSGHKGNDSGSVCDDGLTEARLNFDHATRVAQLLRAQGYAVDILDEFDPRLEGYTSAAFISIHADSCSYINNLATGFKAAHAENSALPDEEDRFLECVKSRYAKATGLKFNASTITVNMTDYHAFRAINPQTPAVIIETGFMNLDRATLTNRADAVAKGIADAALCFLRKES